jgi:hypothetical protein
LIRPTETVSTEGDENPDQRGGDGGGVIEGKYCTINQLQKDSKTKEQIVKPKCEIHFIWIAVGRVKQELKERIGINICRQPQWKSLEKKWKQIKNDRTELEDRYQKAENRNCIIRVSV